MASETTINNISVASIFNYKVRWTYHSFVFITAIFLTVYSTLVCPFIDGLPFTQVLLGLVVVAILQVLIRESVYIIILPRIITNKIIKSYYMYSLLSWGMSGLIASAMHTFLYPEFPIESHLKLLIGYWALGGGFVATIESHSLERRIRKIQNITLFKVSFSKQLLRLFGIFIIIPNIVLVLIVFRFSFEGYIVSGAGYELIFLSTFFSIFALSVGYLYGNELKKDTNELVSALKRVSSGNFIIKLDSTRPDELGFVSQELNKMTVKLKQKQVIEQAFGRFVNPYVAKQFLKDLDRNGNIMKQGRHQCITIMMCDIRNFTAISETMSPKDVTMMLNGHFNKMVKIIHKHNGIIDKFIGDAVMAIFGLEENIQSGSKIKTKSVKNAYRCAYKMLQAMETINLNSGKSKVPIFNIGIGIHYGEVIAGYLGTPKRLDFTVIGANVNLASRIESLARIPNPPLLLTKEATRELDSIVDAPVLCGSTTLKGFSLQVPLYTHPKLLSS